jgi:GH24 family phage-related lysozyme (muramidase)
VAGPQQGSIRTQRAVAIRTGFNDFFQGVNPHVQQATRIAAQEFEAREDFKAQQEIQQNERDNKKAMETFRRDIQVNREAWKKGIDTGDYSGTGVDPSAFLDRQGIVDGIHKATGREFAYNDIEKLDKHLEGVTNPADVDQATRDFIGDQIEGTQSDAYSNEYVDILTKHGSKVQAARRTELQKAAMTKGLEQSAFNARQEFLDTANTWNLDGLEESRGEVTTQLIAAGFTPEGAAWEANAIVDEALIQAAVDRPDLVPLMNKKDDRRGDLSVAERSPGRYHALLTQSTAEQRALKTRDALNEVHEIHQSINRFGTPLADRSLAELSSELETFRQAYGDDSPQYKAAEAAYMKLLSTDAEKQAAVLAILNGELPDVEDGTMNAAVEQVWDNLGNMPPENQAAALSVIAEDGIKGDLQDRIERDLRGSPERRRETVEKLRILKDAGQHAQYSDFLTKEYASEMKAQEYLEESGLSVAEARDTAQDRTANPFTFYKDSLLQKSGGGRSAGTGRGRRSVNDVAKKVWDDVGEGGYQGQPDTIKGLMEESINLAAYHLRDREHSADDIRELAGRIMEGQMGYNLTADGDLQSTPLSAPPGATLPDEASAERFATASGAMPEDGLFGTPSRAVQDEGYKRGKGMLVMTEIDGVELEGNYSPGQMVAFPEDSVDESALELFERAPVEQPEGVFVGRVKEGGADIKMGDKGLWLSYNEDQGVWQQRYRDVPPTPEDRSVSVQDIEGGRLRSKRKLPRGYRPSSSSDTSSGQVKHQHPLARARKRQEAVDGAADEAQSRGLISSAAAAEMKEEFAANRDLEVTAVQKKLQEYQQKTFRETSAIKDNKKGMDLIQSAGSFITHEEGLRTTMYEDTKGIPTIGIGFNLQRPDAKEKIEGLGYDYDKVLKGEMPISKLHAEQLRDVVMQEELNWLKKSLTKSGVDVGTLRGHHWTSLLSLAYNGRVLIGPNLRKHLKAGDWKAAEEEIRLRSNGNRKANPRVIAAIDARRAREADMFAGLSQ